MSDLELINKQLQDHIIDLREMVVAYERKNRVLIDGLNEVYAATWNDHDSDFHLYILSVVRSTLKEAGYE